MASLGYLPKVTHSGRKSPETLLLTTTLLLAKGYKYKCILVSSLHKTQPKQRERGSIE